MTSIHISYPKEGWNMIYHQIVPGIEECQHHPTSLFGQPGLSVEIQVSQDGLLVASEGEHGQRHLATEEESSTGTNWHQLGMDPVSSGITQRSGAPPPEPPEPSHRPGDWDWYVHTHLARSFQTLKRSECLVYGKMTQIALQ